METLRKSGSAEVVRTSNGVTRLLIDGENWMEDTDFERDLHSPVKSMKGSVLYLGLGLGVMLDIGRKVEGIIKQSVLEINPDVVKLTPVTEDVTLYMGDAWEWEPPEDFDYVFIDCLWLPRDGDKSERLANRWAKWARKEVVCFPQGFLRVKGKAHGE